MKEFIKNHIGIVILISAAVIILVITEISGSKNKVVLSPSPTSKGVSKFLPVSQSGYKLPVYSQPPIDTSGAVDANSVKVQSSVSAKSTLAPQLPIYVEGFQTSAGINTTLNVYTIPEDPNYLIHIEIYGINYGDPNILQDGNKNAQAFTEAFNKIKDLLNSKGVNIKNIYFIFGAKPYIQNAADSLIRKYNLL